jgi:hypothetical protein
MAVTPFAPDQWVILLLVFLLGLFVGMYFLAGGKWKRRYREQEALHREELRRREAAEAERRHADASAIAARARDDRVPPPAEPPPPRPARRWFGR